MYLGFKTCLWFLLGYAALVNSQQQAYPSMTGAQVLPQMQQSIMGNYPSTSTYQVIIQTHMIGKVTTEILIP